MIAASRQWFRTFALWLSLLVVLTCALGSFGSPVRASSGSAFNAFTSDVALGPSRAAMPEKGRKEQSPAAGGNGQAKALTAAPASLIPPSAFVVPSCLAPVPAPRATATAGPLGARAPPLG